MAREYGTSVETTASPDRVWQIWSDMSTWGDWNPNVSTMDWQGGFVSGSTGVMNTKAGQHHSMQLVDVQPGRGFALVTSVVPGTKFRFNCRIEPAGAKTKISQTVEVGGPLGPVMGGMLGPQVSKEFGTLLANLARKAEPMLPAALHDEPPLVRSRELLERVRQDDDLKCRTQPVEEVVRAIQRMHLADDALNVRQREAVLAPQVLSGDDLHGAGSVERPLRNAIDGVDEILSQRSEVSIGWITRRRGRKD